MSKRRLGRGLDALLTGEGGDSAETAGDLNELPVDRIVRGRYQPRREFDQHSLEELAASIRNQGLMQPVVVRPRPQGGYELIAGERRSLMSRRRRWRSSRTFNGRI